MSGYFKPFRRKLGVVTLITACAAMAIWVRSLGRGDFVHADNGQLVSFRGRVFIEMHSAPFQYRLFYSSEDDRPTSDAYSDPHFDELWQWRCWGFAYGFHEKVVDLMIPYWSLVVPLTMFSCWLLFSKTRSLKSIKSLEPV